MAENSEEPYGPCGTELVSIVKGYEMFGILLNEKIPSDDKQNRIWKLLKSSHVNVNFQYKHFESNTLLHMAVGRGYVEIVKLIMDRKPNVNIQNEAGDTPMHVAVVRHNIQIIDILLKNGADINLRNNKDETPLDAATTTNKCVIEHLLKTEGQLQIPDEYISIESESSIITKDLDPDKAERDILFTNLPKTHGASGAKNSFHGTVYQLKLLMLFLVRALNLGYQFYLGTEVDEAEQFDDLVFHCLMGETTKSLYLQAKHKENKWSGRITINDLLATDKKAPFSLFKYFRSYLKIKHRISDKADEIDYFICTNTDFHFNEPLKISDKNWEFSFEEVNTAYDAFFKEGKCYRIVLNSTDISSFIGLFVAQLKEEMQALEAKLKICTNGDDKKEKKNIELLKTEIESLKIMSQSVEQDEGINVKLFLKKLFFAVEQPNEDILDKNIKAEFGANFNINLQDNEFISSAYLKRMFDWFKEKGLVKGKEGTFLSHDDAKDIVHSIFSRVNNLISSGISRAFTEELKAFDITFNTDQYQLINNAILHHKIVHLVTTKETRLTAVKFVQALDSSNEFNTDDSYLLLQLSTVLIEKTQTIIEGAFSSRGIYNLLAIECSQTGEDVSALYEKLSIILQDATKVSKKLIIIAEKSHPLAEMLKNHVGYFPLTVINEFKGLSSKSQDDMLEKQVIFQGHSIKLKAIITDETDSQLLGMFPLEALIETEKMIIGANVTTSNGYNQSFYINRTVRRNIQINKDNFDEKVKYLSNDYFAKTVSEFDELCKTNPNSNVHLLKEDGGRYIWVRTKGSLEILHRYVDESNCESFTEETFLESVKSQKVVIISDPAGMGKSTILTSISKQIKTVSPETSVYRIDLDNFTDVLRKVGAKQFDNASSVDFVCNNLIINMTPLEKELFKRKRNLVLLFDGFDEISPDYGDTVIDLLKNLRAATDAQLWITTRPFKRGELENNLQQLSYTLEPFSEDNQFEFLTKYWKVSIQMHESKQYRVGDFAKSLIRNLMESISDKEREFTGIPLQIRMLAECFEEDVKKFADSDLPEPLFGENFNLVGLYKKFITRKYNVYHTEKAKAADDSNLAAKSTQKILEDTFMIHHELLALRAIIPDKVELLTKGSANKISLEDNLSDLNRFGIVQIIGMQPYFMHRTFAEYFIAVFLLDLLKQNQDTDVQDCVIVNILSEDSFQVIRVFLNGLLENSELHLLALRDYGKRIAELWSGGSFKSKFYSLDEIGKRREKLHSNIPFGKTMNNKTMVHLAAAEGNQAIIVYICSCVKTNPDDLRAILLSADNREETILHLAAYSHNSTIVETLLQWIKDNTEKECGQEILRSLLLAQDNEGATVLHKAAQYENRLQELLNWTRDNTDQDQEKKILHSLLLTNTNNGGSVLKEASHCVGTMLSFLQWIRDNMDQYGVDILWSLLLNVNNESDTILHSLVNNAVDGCGILGLLNWIRENMYEEGIRILRLLIPIVNNKGNTVIHRSLNASNGSVTLPLLKWIFDNMNCDEDQDMLRSLLLKQNDKEESVLIMAAEMGEEQIEPLMKFIKCSIGQIEGQEMLEDLLLIPDINGNMPLHRALESIKIEDSIVRLLNSTRDHVDPDRVEETLISMLLAYGETGYTVLQTIASGSGNGVCLNTLFSWTIDNLGLDKGREILKTMLTDASSDECTALHLAADTSDKELFMLLLDWTLDIFGQDEIQNILLRKDFSGFTLLHKFRIIQKDHTSLAGIMLTWTKNNIKKYHNHELLRLMLLAKSYSDETILHTAADRGSGLELVSILQWINDNMDQNQGQSEILLKLILLAKVKNGDTVLHIAARKAYGEVMMPLLCWVNDNVTLEGQSITRLILMDLNENGDTLLHIAVDNGFGLFVASLLKWVRDKLDKKILCDLMSVCNNEGRTAMDLGKGRYEKELQIRRNVNLSWKPMFKVNPKLSCNIKGSTDILSLSTDEEKFSELTIKHDINGIGLESEYCHVSHKGKGDVNEVSWNREKEENAGFNTCSKSSDLNLKHGQILTLDRDHLDNNFVLDKSQNDNVDEVKTLLYAEPKELASDDHTPEVYKTSLLTKEGVKLSSGCGDIALEEISSGWVEGHNTTVTEPDQEKAKETLFVKKEEMEMSSGWGDELSEEDANGTECDQGEVKEMALVEKEATGLGWGDEASEKAPRESDKELVQASEWGKDALELTSGWGYHWRDVLLRKDRAAIVDILQRFESDDMEPTIHGTVCDV